ncbi:nuclear protein MDM1 isoform X3 [Echeneis naucrates]|uniref:nuclear protein MDM1 isoform X3 n=1 Tax=Echeneis naucrates TaxID=173247 RepID=UPI001113A322|nr:nuclear protein MDM1 isoform X3 [Echeneis naucrates]
MTVRFKCQSEYQKSYRAPRTRSVSPQRCVPFGGQMGISRESSLQRRRRLGPAGLAQSCTSLLGPPDPQQPFTGPTARAHRRSPSAPAARSRSAQRKESSLDSEPPESRTDPKSPAEPENLAGPQPTADPGPQDTGPHRAPEPGRPGNSKKPHPSQPDSQPQPGPLTAANEPEHALRWRTGLRSGGQRSEYHRQFTWKKPATTVSPILTAEQQVLYSSSRSVPPFKKNPVTMATEYQLSFQGLTPPAAPRLRKHLEHQRVPLFHTHTSNKKRREESQMKPRPSHEVPTPPDDDATPPPSAQVDRGYRMLTEYQSSFRSPLYRSPEKGGATDGDILQVMQLRQQASSYRRRAWGTNFSRHHLSQLQSENNALWEPTDTTDSATDSATDHPTPRLTFDLCQDPDSRRASCVEPLDLSSHSAASSKRSSIVGSGEINNTNKNTQMKAQASQSPPGGKHTAWGEEEGDASGGGNSDGEEGRLPTPRMKMRPGQRTHHDLTTPATGKLKPSDECSPNKQRSGSAVSMAAVGDTEDDVPVKRREAWSENNPAPASGSSPDHKPPSKAIRMKQTPPPPLAPPPPHCIQGTLRHPDFQHNGDLGLRFRAPPCSGGGCGSDEDDRLSVMSWRSAASCSMASAVLERAQKRRANFWGKR